MFTAMKTSGGWMQAGEVKGFDKSIVNIGHNFDLSTGIFKTPIDGYYSFSFTGYIHSSSILNIRKNGQNTIAKTYGSPDASISWSMRLSKNDEINLYVSVSGGNGIYSSNTYNTVFSGLFIRSL